MMISGDAAYMVEMLIYKSGE